MRDRPLWDPDDPEGYAGEYNHACDECEDECECPDPEPDSV